MPKSSKKVTPKGIFSPPSSHTGPHSSQHTAAFPLWTTIEILCMRYSRLRVSPVDQGRN